MTNVPEPVSKRADELVVGDRILHEYLPGAFYNGPGEILFIRVNAQRNSVSVFFEQDNGNCDCQTFVLNGPVMVHPADTGLGYSRADDGETVQPIAGRVPAHFGAVVGKDGLTAADRAALVEIAEHYDASAADGADCACGQSFGSVSGLLTHIDLASAGGLLDIDPTWNPETGFFEPGRVPELVGDDLPSAPVEIDPDSSMEAHYDAEMDRARRTWPTERELKPWESLAPQVDRIAESMEPIEIDRPEGFVPASDGGLTPIHFGFLGIGTACFLPAEGSDQRSQVSVWAGVTCEECLKQAPASAD